MSPILINREIGGRRDHHDSDKDKSSHVTRSTTKPQTQPPSSSSASSSSSSHNHHSQHKSKLAFLCQHLAQKETPSSSGGHRDRHSNKDKTTSSKTQKGASTSSSSDRHDSRDNIKSPKRQPAATSSSVPPSSQPSTSAHSESKHGRQAAATANQSSLKMEPAVLDSIIIGLTSDKRWQISEAQIRQLCIAAGEIFLQQPNLLDLEAPLRICGDIHGQYTDLLRLLEYGGFPPTSNYLFLGDYVDHGKQSLETICLLLAYKIKYPENFFLLRGNHECASINRIYGFYDECKRRFNVRLWKSFTECFNCLPVAAIIDDKILCMHGGLSPDLTHLDQIRALPRPVPVPDTGLLCDLLWSDPGRDVKGWGMNDRGVSYTFGPDKVSEFLEKHDLDLVCRAHQVVEDGYEFFAERQLVTIFSAPNYCGEFDNAGAMMSVDENLMCSFQILKPAEKKAKFMIPNKI